MHIAHYDAELGAKLRQIQVELKEWADLAEKGKLSDAHAARMRFESDSLNNIISNKEL